MASYKQKQKKHIKQYEHLWKFSGKEKKKIRGLVVGGVTLLALSSLYNNYVMGKK
jgi:hypothetical protein